jgi:hypothetical protein
LFILFNDEQGLSSHAQTSILYPSGFGRPRKDASDRWWIAKVKPRQEKLLAGDLLETEY